MSALRQLFAFSLTALLAAACGGGSTATPGGGGGGGGGGGSGGGAPTAGIALPTEFSALPPVAAAQQSVAGARSAFLSVRGQLATAPAGSDLAKAQSVIYVHEEALTQFDILDEVLKAIAETNYADAANVGQGAYAAVVTAPGGKGGDENANQKTLTLWKVTSEMVNGVNVVSVWFTEVMDPQAPPQQIRAQIRISEAPTQNADGSYADYGVWTLTAEFGVTGDAYFVASADKAAGMTVVKVHEENPRGGMKGILYRSGTSGYGKVEFPDWNQCHAPDCAPPPTTVAYVYDAHHVEMKVGDAAPVFKDREATVDIVDRYGVFDAVTGQDVAAVHHFGFPFNYEKDGVTQYGYYGAWQGRHQIWANGAALPAGTVVTRADHAPGAPVETFTASAAYTGILVKRALRPVALAQLTGLVLGTWDNQNYQLVFDGSAWRQCDGWLNWRWDDQLMTNVPVCSVNGVDTAVSSLPTVSDFSGLQSAPMRHVNLSTCDQSGCAPLEVVGGAFQDAGTHQPWIPQFRSVVNVNVGGQIWLTFDGSAWSQKEVLSVDPDNHQPVFGAGSTPYTLPLEREYYLNDMGVSYVVKRTSGGFVAQAEVQTVANPLNVATFVPAGTVFHNQWGDASAEYRFVTDVASPNFMKLVYGNGALVDQPVTAGQWGLVATIEGQQVQFNWEYPNAQDGCQGCGVQQFLKSGDTYVTLEDPIHFAPVDLVNGAGATRTFSLSFDGQWMSGLPDLWNDLNASGFLVTPAIQAKAVAVPDEQILADAEGHQFVVKQLRVSQYLALLGSDPGGLELAPALAIDLTQVPAYVPTGLSPTPPDGVLKYSEGKPVQ